MTNTTTQTDLLQQLQTFGDPRDTWKWREDRFDYVAALGVTPEDIPQLIQIAWQRLDDIDWSEIDDDDISVDAPIHAWRALAQLRAVEAIPMFLDLMDPMEKNDDDWYLEEFPWAFAHIGPSSMEALTTYLHDESHLEYPRICAGHALRLIAEKNPEMRERVVSVLSKQLSVFHLNTDVFNAFMIMYLMDMKATEAADVIEWACAADCVEIDTCGNWNDIRKELGVPGKGLVPEKLANARRSFLSPVKLIEIIEEIRVKSQREEEERQARREREKRAMESRRNIKRKVARKRERQSRKKNRKRKR